jgi:hypothetical protein
VVSIDPPGVEHAAAWGGPFIIARIHAWKMTPGPRGGGQMELNSRRSKWREAAREAKGSRPDQPARRW